MWPKPDLVMHHSPTGCAGLVIQPNKGCSSVLTLFDPPGGRQSHFCSAAWLSAPSPISVPQSSPVIWGRKGELEHSFPGVGELEHSFPQSAATDCLQNTALAWWITAPRSKAKRVPTEGLTLFLPAILDAHIPSVCLAFLCMPAGTSCTALDCFCFGEKRSRN